MKKNLFRDIPADLPEEVIEQVAGGGEVHIERILSRGHASPPGCWYDQVEDEWVLLLQGAARLRFEDMQEPLDLAPGDCVHIPAHRRHRVEWTPPETVTIWLAVHYQAGRGTASKTTPRA